MRSNNCQPCKVMPSNPSKAISSMIDSIKLNDR